MVSKQADISVLRRVISRFWVLILLCQPVQSVFAADRAELQAQLAGAQGADRVPLLLDLVRTSFRSDPVFAIETGKALEIALREHPDPPGRAWALSTLAYSYIELGQYEQALRLSRQSLALAESIPSIDNSARAWRSIGMSLYKLNRLDDAVDAYHKALQQYQSIDHKLGILSIYNNLAVIHDDRGERLDSLRNYNKALEMAREVGDANLEAAVLANLGTTYQSFGDYPSAMQAYLDALRIKEESGDNYGMMEVLENLSQFHLSQGQFAQALSYAERSHALAVRSGNANHLANSLNTLGLVGLRTGAIDAAFGHFREALKTSQDLDDALLRAEAMHNLGAAELERGNLLQAADHLEQALAIRKQSDALRESADTLILLAGALRRMGKPALALSRIEDAIALGKQLSDLEMQLPAYDEMRKVLSAMGRHEAALQAYEHYQSAYTSIFNRDRNDRMALLQIQYETEKQKQQIELLSREKHLAVLSREKAVLLRNFLIALAITLLLMLALIASRFQLSRRVAQEQRRLSLLDPLTGMGNRRFVEHSMTRELADIRRLRHRNEKRSQSLLLMLIDLDDFKSINDTYGHDSGDMVLLQFSQLMLETLRDTDMQVRWGGEEFLAVSRISNREHARTQAERMLEAVAQHPFKIADDREVSLRCSIGFSFYPLLPRKPEALSWQQTLEVADAALYTVKNNGKNNWVGISASGDIDAAEPHRYIANNMAEALEKQEIRIDTGIAGRLSFATQGELT